MRRGVQSAMERQSILERLARHLAATDPQSRPDLGPDPWQSRVEDAASLIAILKDPDDEMRAAGDERIWRAMIDAALRERWTVAGAAPESAPVGGTDEEGEVPLSPESIGGNSAQWVHLHPDKEARR